LLHTVSNLLSLHDDLPISSRSLYSLARSGNAPKRFGELSAKAVPNHALTFSSLILFITVILNYIMPAGIFDVIAGISTITFIFTWIIILIAHIKFRQQNPKGVANFRMPGYPITSWLTIIFFLAVLVILLFIDTTRIPLILSIVIFALLAYGYGFLKKKNSKLGRDSEILSLFSFAFDNE